MTKVFRKHLDFEAWEKKALKNPGLKKEYEKLQPEYDLIEVMIAIRSKKGITQKVLAQKMRTKQSVISRLESGNANPSFEFVKRLASALGTDIHIKFAA
ncbi:MAG: helix-turn-helix transcriptional regulator [Patescibacteria group bacterium]